MPSVKIISHISEQHSYNVEQKYQAFTNKTAMIIQNCEGTHRNENNAAGKTFNSSNASHKITQEISLVAV